MNVRKTIAELLRQQLNTVSYVHVVLFKHPDKRQIVNAQRSVMRTKVEKLGSASGAYVMLCNRARVRKIDEPAAGGAVNLISCNARVISCRKSETLTLRRCYA